MRIVLSLVIASLLPLSHAMSMELERAPAAGVCLYFDGYIAREEGAQERIESHLDELAASHFNSVCIAFPFHMARWDASTVSYQEEFIPTDNELKSLIAEIRDRGMSAGLRPILEETALIRTGPPGVWRGAIVPEDRVAWFESYTQLVTHYAALSEESGATWLAIGTELSTLEAPEFDPFWRELIRATRETLGSDSLELLYSQNHDRVPYAPNWLDELDILAIDAYFPLEGVDNDASIEELVLAMEHHRASIEEMQAKFPDKPLYITEVGVSSVNDVYHRPFMWGELSDSPANMETQRRYAAAACQFYTDTSQGSPLVDGIYWWFTTIDPPSDPLQDKGFDFMGKPAENEIAACNKSFAGQNH